MHYLLFYEVGHNYVSRRAQFRELHLKKAWEAAERGELVLAGASGKQQILANLAGLKTQNNC